MAIEIERGSARARIMLTVLAIIGLAILLRLPFAYGPYRVFQFTLVFIWAIAVMGLNLLIGYSGQISVGHNAFFACGAYTAAILMHRYDTNFMLCMIAAGALSFLLGLMVGIPALRLRGLHLAIVTLALAMATTAILQRFDGLTGGAGGLSVPRAEAPTWTGLEDDQYMYFLSLTVAVIMYALARNIVKSGFGRALIAVKDNPIAADAMGIDARVFKVLAFATSGMFAGIAGVLYVLAIGYVSPEAFPLLLSVTFLAAIAVGGLGTISGSVVGAIFVQFTPQLASEINDSLATLIYGSILILVMIVMPQGIAGRFAQFGSRFVRFVEPIDRREASEPPPSSTTEPTVEHTESPPNQSPVPSRSTTADPATPAT